MARKALYAAVRAGANLAWNGFQAVNRRVPARSFHPTWAPEPLPKTSERTKPPLGYPRRPGFLLNIFDLSGAHREGLP